MLKDKPMQALIAETNRVLTKAVDHGLKDNLPEPEMIAKLKNDVFVFSACKTHIELKEASLLLTDENGKVKGYDKFSQDVAALGKLYNENYLQAEYIFATSSAEMAAKWGRFEKDGDRYNLQYRTARDTKVRDTHAKLADTTLPVNDPFWDSYFPPNGWRCRCTTVQVLKEKYPVDNSVDAIKKAETATTQIDSKGRNRAEMFRFNPGKQKVIFPPNHPYRKVQETPGVKSAIDSENIKPSTTEDEIKDLPGLNKFMDKLATDHPEYFVNGFKNIEVGKNPNHNGSTNGFGLIKLNQNRIDKVIEGLNHIHQGKKTTYDQEDSFSTLWHEITHNKHKAARVKLTDLERQRMELANEFVSRNTLSKFIKDLGGELNNVELTTNRPSTRYNPWVRNYDSLILWSGADKAKVVESVSDHLFNKPYGQQTAGLADAIMKNTPYNLKKSTVNGLVSKTTKYENHLYDSHLNQNNGLLAKKKTK